MASFNLKPLLCLLIVSFCFNVEAREGKLSFSKFTRLDHSNNKEVTLTPAPAPGLAEDEGKLGDGHFGPGSGMIPQTKETWPDSSTTTDEEFEKLMDTFEQEKNNNLPEEFEKEEDSEDVSEQKDKYNNNNNGYTYTTNNNYNDNKRNYGNEEERQGMSDRFMENGKYFYDTRGMNYENTPSRGYESARGNDHPNEFETMEEYYKSLEGGHEEYQP